MKKRTIFSLLALLFVMVMVVPLAGCAAAASTTGDIETSPIAMQAAYVVLDITATAATAMIGVAGAWALAKIGQNKNLANLNIAIGQVIDAAQQTVGELQQTVVGGLKAAASDGKLTEAQIAELKRQLLRRTSEKLTAPVVQMLEAAKLDVNALIQGAAEDMINSMHTTTSLLEQGVEVKV